MSTIEVKSNKTKTLNTKLMPIAAGILILLALLFMATPLLRQTRRFQGNGNIIRQGSGQSFQPNATPGQGNAPQFFSGPGGGAQGQGFSGQSGSNFPNRRVIGGIGFLSGRSGPVVYFVALLISIAAALGMFFAKRWGQILGIFMAVLYLLAGLVSLLPILLISTLALRNSSSLVLGIVHVLLAIAVIVLAAIPAKKVKAPVVVGTPPPSIRQ